LGDSALETKTLLITEDLAGLRLDKAIATLSEVMSRSRAAHLIEQGLVTTSEGRLKASRPTVLGETYTIRLPTSVPSELKPYDFPLSILFEDDDIIVLDKPAGLVMHPAAGHLADTLVNVLLHHAKNLAMGFSEERPGLVHRLDKETSGVLVVAKNDFSHEALAKQFRQRTTHRIYRAVVYGQPKRVQGTIQSHLRRHPRDRKRFASEVTTPHHSPKGKLAITHFKVLKNHPQGVSLLECKLETGRTHQIRVHLSESGHAVFGDHLYGPRRIPIASAPLRAMASNFERIALHAAELGFLHPRDRRPLQFATPWPEDMSVLMDYLGWS
jgi:23S rRNA pseudouridine1911/1915/1917 synthase